MKELDIIGQEVDKLRAGGKRAVLATVVGIEGSSYRLPGARMLVADAIWKAGSVSGGCLEGDVVLRAREVLEKNRATVATYDTTSDEDILFGVGLGCRGIIRVLIEPITPEPAQPDLIGYIRHCLAKRENGVVATVIGVEGKVDAMPGTRLVRASGAEMPSDISDPRLKSIVAAYVAGISGSEASHSAFFDVPGGQAEVFIEVIRPPLPFVIFGAGHDAIAMARLGKELGWRVTVVDHRPAYATAQRFPEADEVIVAATEEIRHRVRLDKDTVALIMTHNYLRDLEALKILLPSPVRYVGLLGPRRRADELTAELQKQSFTVTPEQRGRLYAPVGLDLGAEGPEGVALSVLAEIQAVVAGRAPGHLRERK
ncbi:MAG TPA: XdhC family protein, partial [Burkholderiales bacterium]|nr:XdhC family protein [Burkholderiales bacterium]